MGFKVNIIPAVSFIGIIPSRCLLSGVRAEFAYSDEIQVKAELAGGTILVLLGLKYFWTFGYIDREVYKLEV